MVIFRKGYKKSFQYDIAREFESKDKELEWLISRIDTYYHKEDNLTQAGMERMNMLLLNLKKSSRNLKNLVKTIRKEASS